MFKPLRLLVIGITFLTFEASGWAQATAETDNSVALISKLSYKDASVKAKMISVAESFRASVAESEFAGKALAEEGAKEPSDRTALRQAMLRYVKSDEMLDPYVAGAAEADKLRAAGKMMSAPIDFSLCDGAGTCSSVDPIVAFFFALGKALEGELNQKKPFGPNNDLVKFLQRPAGGDGSDLVKGREATLRALGIGGKNNDLTKVIRDPGNEARKQAGKLQKAIRKAFRL